MNLDRELEFVKNFLRKEIQFYESKIDLTSGDLEPFNKYAEASKCLKILNDNSELYRMRIQTAESEALRANLMDRNYKQAVFCAEYWHKDSLFHQEQSLKVFRQMAIRNRDLTFKLKAKRLLQL